jgi:hypothetical protein
MITEENRVVMYFTFTGTHTGVFMGVAPTGKKITLRAIVTWRIVDGKIVEKASQVWDFIDIYNRKSITGVGLYRYIQATGYHRVHGIWQETLSVRRGV